MLVATKVSFSSVLSVLSLVGGVSAQIGGQSGVHTDLPRWCGKPYKAGHVQSLHDVVGLQESLQTTTGFVAAIADRIDRSPNYDPGGELHKPKPSAQPMLDLKLESRHSIYDSSETAGQFIVDAALSSYHGQPFTNVTSMPGSNQTAPFVDLDFDIRVEATDQLLVSNNVTIGSIGNLFGFDITSLKPRLQPYRIVLYGAPMHESGSQTYTASTEIYYLPAKHSGSTVKIDNLHGGMLVANNVTQYAFQPLLPFGFYTSCGGYLNYSLANVSAYKDFGFTAINPVCAFTDGDLSFLFDWMDEIDLWYQYDMRNSYLNLSSVAEQIPLLKDRSNMLSWYTADEPDGNNDALNGTSLAYELLKREDPYHPTGLVLNCDNYYFKQYTAGTDYIMEDAYPIGINATWSRPYGVPCNQTYGDCGCDDCIGELQDVSNRLDTLQKYQDWLGGSEKPQWAVLQAFSGEGYWNRDPSPEETWAMMVISINHGAKAIMSWTFPSTDSLNQAHGAMAKVAASSPVRDFLLGGEPVRIKVKSRPLIDVSYWTVGRSVMVAIANLEYVPTTQIVKIKLPFAVTHLAATPWGTTSWALSANGTLSTRGLGALATDILILSL